MIWDIFCVESDLSSFDHHLGQQVSVLNCCIQIDSMDLSQCQHDPSCCDGVGLSVVVVEGAADVGGEGAELVVGEVGPGLAGELQGALVLEWGRGNLEVVEQGVQDAEVEGGVVGDDEIGGGEVGDDFVSDVAELGLVLHIEPGEAVDVLGP